MYDFYPLDDEYYMGTSSAHDCTGLIPAGLTDDEVSDYYEDIYPYLPPDTEFHTD